ncbi:MAG: hypothetical protein JWN48_5710 [Myxococcaceae bacterium]|nr:hypothetical protein [Myxococcaceae bacterium]
MKRHRALALALLSILMACSGKFCGDSYLAELEAHQGEVQRDEARAVGTWGSVNKGDRFRVGDGLRTGHSGSAQLDLAADGVALVEANTVLRFLDRDPRGGRHVSLEEGIVRIDAGEFDLDVHMPRALARIAKGASIRIVAAAADTRFDVLVGKVAIDTAGTTRELVAGQSISLNEVTAAAAAAEQEKATADARAEAARASANAEKQPGELSAQDAVALELPELDAMTLHAPSLPLTFRLEPPACTEAVTAEMDGRPAAKSTGGGSPLLLRVTTAGAHRVRVRCGKRVVRESTLRVFRDAANLELPKSAQRVELEADGRRYTVRYQNVMPVVNVHWSDARPAASYVLLLRRGKHDQSFRVTAPVREIAGNELTEGNYDFWFTSESGQQSRVSSLRIEFDNTARSLSLSEPVEGSAASGNTVLVSGVALLRSSVAANGVPLALDPKGRFHAQVPLSAEKSVLVRATHPAAGVHYYLRRLH